MIPHLIVCEQKQTKTVSKKYTKKKRRVSIQQCVLLIPLSGKGRDLSESE